MDDFNVHSENTVPSPGKKSHITLWTLLLAAVIALACGYLSSNSQENKKVVIQKVSTSNAEGSVTPAFERLAEEQKITVEKMRAIIAARMEAGMNDPDPEKQASWERIPRTGEIPMPEEWLRYAAERLEAEGRWDLLRWHKIF